MKAINLMLIVLSLTSTDIALGQNPAPGDIQPAESAPSSGVNVHEKNQSGYRYVCGGVGSDESAYLKQIAKNYDLMSTFARRDGSYLADIRIAIKDKNGQMPLQFTCSGPMMLISFPRPGTYQIQAEVGDSKIVETVQIPAKGQAHAKVFEWPAN
ncbi:hypothetical protein [Glaciimonas sp. PAMC28666]|uniref:hypothetical protein n=1 Tax=Glaciimonas sp. PAMC28666 TaxID=2807626 RepID=UPI0019630B88|nr:hypothetical protein [Glaciimonas sp. PAMC28666]QRX82414.1 hypothetical protein JQN73_20400 [Glaciimonas sp. PAMC28666]